MTPRPYTIVPFEKGSTTYRVKRYRERAEELRAIAQDLLSDDCQETLMRLASTYEQMASQAEIVSRAPQSALSRDGAAG